MAEITKTPQMVSAARVELPISQSLHSHSLLWLAEVGFSSTWPKKLLACHTRSRAVPSAALKTSTMPRPEHAAVACVFAIVISGGRLTDYYVLEHGWTARYEPRTVMCKCDDRGHVNFGDGPPVGASAFLAAIEQLLAPSGTLGQ